MYGKKKNIVINEHFTYFKITYMSWQEIKSSARILFIIDYCSFLKKNLLTVFCQWVIQFYLKKLEKLQLLLNLRRKISLLNECSWFLVFHMVHWALWYWITMCHHRYVSQNIFFNPYNPSAKAPRLIRMI